MKWSSLFKGLRNCDPFIILPTDFIKEFSTVIPSKTRPGTVIIYRGMGNNLSKEIINYRKKVANYRKEVANSDIENTSIFHSTEGKKKVKSQSNSVNSSLLPRYKSSSILCTPNGSLHPFNVFSYRGGVITINIKDLEAKAIEPKDFASKIALDSRTGKITDSRQNQQHYGKKDLTVAECNERLSDLHNLDSRFISRFCNSNETLLNIYPTDYLGMIPTFHMLDPQFYNTGCSLENETNYASHVRRQLALKSSLGETAMKKEVQGLIAFISMFYDYKEIVCNELHPLIQSLLRLQKAHYKLEQTCPFLSMKNLKNTLRIIKAIKLRIIELNIEIDKSLDLFPKQFSLPVAQVRSNPSDMQQNQSDTEGSKVNIRSVLDPVNRDMVIKERATVLTPEGKSGQINRSNLYSKVPKLEPLVIITPDRLYEVPPDLVVPFFEEGCKEIMKNLSKQLGTQITL